MRLFPILAACVFAVPSFAGSVWQWSVPAEKGRAFLWVPPDCTRVKAVVLGQHNMLEEGLFENPRFREALAKEGIAEVWFAPPQDGVFRFDQGAGEQFEALLAALSQESGYSEIATAPVVPVGHSACASYPWNFAAWKPERTLAILSVKGDAPLTKLTGSGKPSPEWGSRGIDGIPGLMVMGEYEWWDDRLQPALAYRQAHPAAPVSMLAEPGEGHFNASDELAIYLGKFLSKAAAVRLPLRDGEPLRAVDPTKGWLMPRWTLRQPYAGKAAPFAEYQGDRAEAFWTFDEEMAKLTLGHGADQIGKKPQLLGFVQDGRTVPQQDIHQQVTLKFQPEDDGITFTLGTTFLDQVEGGCKNLARWTDLPVGAPLGHAAGPIDVQRITGPVAVLGGGKFQLRLNRTWSTIDARNGDVWLAATQSGDATYKHIVQQAKLPVSPGTTGQDQTITFPDLADVTAATKEVTLAATSDSGLPVSYYVREGPAEIESNRLHLTAIPPRAKFPVKVTVVAWQWGRGGEHAVKTAPMVEKTFSIGK